MKLTPNFSLEEFCHSVTATRAGIANIPGPTIAAHLYTLATGLEKVREVLGNPMTILSGFRCEQLEHLLCQKDFEAWCGRHGKTLTMESWQLYFAGKAHPKGYAADFICPGFGAPLAIVRELQKSNLKWDQLIQEGSWVHVSFAPEMRQQVLTAHFEVATGTPSYTQGA